MQTNVTSVAIDDKTTTALTKGNTLTLSATVDDVATDKTVVWSSSDDSVASVENGVVTANKSGTATITVTATNGTEDTSDDKTDTITITVTNPATGISLNKSTLTLTKGDTDSTLSATVTPDDADDKSVTWTSSDTSIATVDGTGKVTGVKAGTATITAKAGDKTATCTVTVSEPTPSVTFADAFEDGATITLKVNDVYGVAEINFVNNNGHISYVGQSNSWFTEDARASISGDNLTIQLCGYMWSDSDFINTFVFNKANNTYSYSCGGYRDTIFSGLVINGVDITDQVTAQ